MSEYVLPILLLLPVIGAIVTAVLPRARDAKLWALLVALLMGVVGVYLLVAFPYSQRGWQFAFPSKDSDWLGLSSIGFRFSLGIDTISLWLVALTVLLMPLAIAASFDSITDRPKQ